MDKQLFIENCRRVFSESKTNAIPADKALDKSLAGVRIYEEPLIGLAAADDARFVELRRPGLIGAHFLPPKEWLPPAQTVVSFFFPFTAAIREDNKRDFSYPSPGWLNGRIEGQASINAYAAAIVSFLREQGYGAVAPSLDSRFLNNASQDECGLGCLFTSNWSERHVAFICGLGTFSLSKGLITEKGMAGRFTSVITELALPADALRFARYDENCIMCGKCAKNCPAGAISLAQGKDHAACSTFVDAVWEKNAPWYGCGKCQVAVPCECQNPRRESLQHKSTL